MRTPALVLLASAALGAQSASLRPEGLRAEYRADPLGIDVAQPRLSWRVAAVASGARGLRQSAYRILVASSETGLAAAQGDLWDSGRVRSDESTQIVYRGRPAAEARGVKFLRIEAGAAVFGVESGAYRFVASESPSVQVK